MATLTLEYNSRSKTASKIIDIILAMDNVFKVKVKDQPGNGVLTRNAMEDVINGDIITCESFDDYLKQTSHYA